MKLRTHHIVRVPRQNRYLVPVLPVPDSHGLIVARADYPGQFHVELDGTHVVHMALKCEHAFFHLVVPQFDQVIVAS